MISMVSSIFDQLGIEGLTLEINSIGCQSCRRDYNEALKAYFRSRESELCDTCRDRLERNPMRILDCKCPDCKKVAEGAPHIIDYLCDDCRAHFVNKMNREYIKTFNKHKCKTFKQDFYENQRPIEAPADGTDAYDAPF